ncbi:mitochondrial genome maintenance protein Mgr2 [Peziza echinospora]|nr:mitochondrial genome maintenance protein Mgr2 [Peziza echinospora]
MPPAPSSHHGGGMSTFDKMKMGAIMGGSVGLCIGFIFGGYAIIKGGAGPNGVIRSLGQYMLGSAATFGFFMSIGTAIRTQGHEGSPQALVWEKLAREQRYGVRASPLIFPRPAAFRKQE